MGQDEVIQLLKKYKRGLTVEMMSNTLKLSHSAIRNSITRLRRDKMIYDEFCYISKNCRTKKYFLRRNI